jgi:transcriptional regulator with XRE-family HTH domain
MQVSLKTARINANFTQSEAAERLNISVSALRRWEQRKSFPAIERIPAICELYGVHYDNINFSK